MSSSDTDIRFLDKTPEKAFAESLFTRNPAMLECLALTEAAALSVCPALITGENGAGKSLIALRLHQASPRSDRPLVTLKCGDLLRDGELRRRLFGRPSVRLSPSSDSVRIQPLGGLLGQAAGGCLVLKNVEYLSGGLQRELLSILKEYARPDADPVADGSGLGRQLGVRLIATANVGTGNLTASGAFLEELLFALGEITIRVPPLRARPEDLDHLSAMALKAANRAHGKMVRGLSRSARDFMAHYAFPGNVRELFTLVGQAVRNGGNDAIYVEDLGWSATLRSDDREPAESGQTSLADVEKRHINQLLLRTGWKKSATARLLHISETMLARKIKLYGLEDGE